MITEMQEFMTEQTQALTVRARKFGKAPVKAARAAAENSADGIKSLKSPIRAIARAGVQLTAVSQTAVQSLIELESDMLTAVLSDASARLTQAARADGLVELVRDQTGTLRATGERIVSDATRAVEIVTDAGQDIRKLATRAYGTVVKAGEGKPAKATRATKGKRAPRTRPRRASPPRARRSFDAAGRLRSRFRPAPGRCKDCAWRRRRCRPANRSTRSPPNCALVRGRFFFARGGKVARPTGRASPRNRSDWC